MSGNNNGRDENTSNVNETPYVTSRVALYSSQTKKSRGKKREVQPAEFSFSSIKPVDTTDSIAKDILKNTGDPILAPEEENANRQTDGPEKAQEKIIEDSIQSYDSRSQRAEREASYSKSRPAGMRTGQKVKRKPSEPMTIKEPVEIWTEPDGIQTGGPKSRRIDHLVVKKKKSRSKAAWVRAIILALVLSIIVRLFLMEFTHVSGVSMDPTLQSGEIVLVNKIMYSFLQPARGDIVIARFPGAKTAFVKRVVGLPGETVEIKKGKLYIDGESSFDLYGSSPFMTDMEMLKVPDDSVYLIGDNRKDSKDSRVYGPIKKENLLGRAQAVVWPLDKLEWMLEK